MTAATSFAAYVDLVRRAETLLAGCGIRDAESRLHILAGIYYGADWSRDSQGKPNQMRNQGFRAYVGRTFGPGDDPRQCLGCGLFESLRNGGDVQNVDMGHVLIGMDARMRPDPRSKPVPQLVASGLEIVTWAGDLGGAVGRLAADRITNPATPAGNYFRNSYGTSTNLGGDVAAYLVGAQGPVLSAPSLPGGRVADALEAFFVRKIGFADRCKTFLQMLGGRFSGGTLANRQAVLDYIQARLAGFATAYLVTRYRNPVQALNAQQNIPPAAREVAEMFLSKLERCSL